MQSNYIPWKGYFDMIASADEFILYDDMQYTRRDWRNRNLIKTPNGTQWLTVPVIAKGKYTQTIRETEINGTEWIDKHIRSMESNYRRAPCFEEISSRIFPVLKREHTHLHALNRDLIETICEYLNIDTKLSNSWDYELVEGKTEKLCNLCIQAGGQEYISGPNARSYIDDSVFDEASVKLTWFSYDNYPEYPQQWGEFVHGVSILDLLFNCGQDSGNYMKYVNA